MAGRRNNDPITRDLKDGNARHATPVHIPAEAPPMPDYFNKSATLPAVWKEIVVRFNEMSILALTDGPTLEAYCILVDQMRRMKEYLAVNGETYTATMKDGERRLKRPEYDILKDTMLRLKTFAIEIGATPASRGKVPSLLQGDLFNRGKDSKNTWSDFTN